MQARVRSMTIQQMSQDDRTNMIIFIVDKALKIVQKYNKLMTHATKLDLTDCYLLNPIINVSDQLRVYQI